MAIQNQQESTSTMGQAFAAANAGVAANQPQAQPRQNRTFSWGNFSSLASQPLPINPASETLTKLKTQLTEVFKNGAANYVMGTVELDRENIIELTHSVLVVTLKDKNNPQFGTVFRPVVIAASSEPFQQQFQNINGRNVAVDRLPSDAVTAKLLATVAEEMRRANPNEKLIGTEALVLPVDFQSEDKDRLHAFALNVIMACRERLDVQKPGWADINIADAAKDSTLTARPAIMQGAPDQLDALGLPFRADIRAVLQAQQNGQQQGEGRVTTVTELSAFIDLVWNPAQQVSQNPFLAPQVAVPQVAPKYQPRLVITQMRSPKLQTIGGQLLALLPALALYEKGLALQALRPRPLKKGEVNHHDIGAIGVEAGLVGADGQVIKQVIDTQASSFTDQFFYYLMNAAVRPELLVSLDISEAGADSWFNGVFLAAAAGKDNAYKAIYDHANQLTNGNFGQLFPFGNKIVFEDNRFHAGYFVDKAGEKRSLAHVDYLYILNTLGVNDPVTMKDWSDSLSPNAPYHPLERLAIRKRILDNLFPSAVYTGYTRRVTFSAEFLLALAKAAAAAGLSMTTNSPFASVASYERASAGFDQAALLGTSQVNTGLFNAGFQQAAQAGGYGYGAGVPGRW